MDKEQLNTPLELLYGPFPVIKQFPCIMTESFIIKPAFLHEANYYHNKNTFQPWNKENLKDCVNKVIQEWKQLREELQQFVRQRDTPNLQNGLTLGMEYFLECLYWINEKPVMLKDGLVDKSLEIKPFNIEDRLQFILKRLNGYHSYKQLDELFKELEKQFAIKLIKSNRKE
ncbi:YpoC family protein [Niallia sp. FSL W8-0635]|uniref:YpoC family protein n=1 Tax=Niallia sp. FSL W8-0635 TaxID=2975337 RepID=UPI0030FBAD77